MHLNVTSRGRTLERNVHYRVSRSAKSRGYAVELLIANVRWVRLDAAFGPGVEPPRIELPLIPEVEWQKIATDLFHTGEQSIAMAIEDSSPGDARTLSEIIKTRSRYTYHPESSGAPGEGRFGELIPFQNPEGVLCIQCSHAAKNLLDPMLKTGYRDEPNFYSRATAFLQRKGRVLVLPAHSAVELYWKGELVEYLNPVPVQLDERAPTRTHISRAESAERRASAVKLLGPIRAEIEARSVALVPRALPADSPLHRLWGWATAAIGGKAPSIPKVSAERERLYRWIKSDVGTDRSARAIQTYFQSLRTDLDRLAEVLLQVARESECARKLERLD